MKFLLLNFLLVTYLQADTLQTLDDQLASADEEVQKLEKDLKERVEEYNRLLKLKASGQTGADLSYMPRSEVPVSTMTMDQKRVEELEKRLAALELKQSSQAPSAETPKSELSKARAVYEHEASMQAPKLDVDSAGRLSMNKPLSF